MKEECQSFFVHCEVASLLWQKLFRETGYWEIREGCHTLFCHHCFGFGKGKKAKDLWHCSIVAVIWDLKQIEDYIGVWGGWGSLGEIKILGSPLGLCLWFSKSTTFLPFSYIGRLL